MLKNNLFPVALLLSIIGMFYAWTFSVGENLWLTSIGINILQILIGTVSLFWLFQAYRNAEERQKTFWRLLFIGLVFYLSSNWFWLYLQVSNGNTNSEGFSYIVWLIAYLFYLAALVSKIRELSAFVSQRSYLFNIAVFMITAASISYHFLIKPVLELSGGSWLLTIVSIVFNVTDLTVLFVVCIMYYLLQKNSNQEFLILCITGFVIQVAADFLFAHAAFEASYQPGHLADLLWLLSTAFIGLTGFHARKKEGIKTWIMKNPVENKEAIFPYLSILILLGLVMHSYQYNFNALSTGLLLAFFLILGRQLQILRKNHQLMDQYKYLAYHDPLTGLNNRGGFVKEVERILTNYPSRKIALLLIDLDQFKVVNDTLGHHIGDKVLIETAARLEAVSGEDTLLFRLGGDEFTVVLLDATDEKCNALATGILAAFQESLVIDAHEVSVTPSIGISKFPEHGRTTEELMINADAAMYLTKENGKNGYSFFNADLSQEKIRKMTIETELKKAIPNRQFQLYYQPKIELMTNKIVGMEALLRWQHPKLGWVSPIEFIPVAEETGQIVAIGEWVLQEACLQNKRWQEMGFPPLSVSVNVSVLQFKHGGFLEMIQKTVDKTGLETQYLELEITESIMQNIEESKRILVKLREMGIKTSIDDFGTGYSSLHVLQKLPIDTIKIDKSFVDELNTNTMNPMVKTIIDLGLNLNLSIVAEGIESATQRENLLGHGCVIGQGYLFSRPVAPEEFEKLMEIPVMLNGKM